MAWNSGSISSGGGVDCRPRWLPDRWKFNMGPPKREDPPPKRALRWTARIFELCEITAHVECFNLKICTSQGVVLALLPSESNFCKYLYPEFFHRTIASGSVFWKYVDFRPSVCEVEDEPRNKLWVLIKCSEIDNFLHNNYCQTINDIVHVIFWNYTSDWACKRN